MPKSEFRRNLITKRWVVIAAERSRRPLELRHMSVLEQKNPDICPFCPGNEAQTPPTILSYAKDDGSGWKIRVFANKYRALSIEGKLDKQKRGIFRNMNGMGAHELIVTTPEHKTLYELSDSEMNDTLWACKDRMLDLKKAVDEGEPKIYYIIIFGNQGETAGGSQKHGHLQLIGLPIAPEDSWKELSNCEEYWDEENECLFCNLTAQESEEKTRIVSENDNFLSICDYSGKFPFETWILPRNHRPLFEDSTDKNIRALAEVAMDTLRRIGKALNYPPFNLYFHNTPLHDRNHDRYYHFNIKIIPRLSQPAGFELGTGFYINPIIPEDAARILREVKL